MFWFKMKVVAIVLLVLGVLSVSGGLFWGYAATSQSPNRFPTEKGSPGLSKPPEPTAEVEVAIKVDATKNVFLLPGDQVDVHVQFRDSTTGELKKGVVLENVKITEIGPRDGEQVGVNLRVKSEQASRLVNLSKFGATFTLVLHSQPRPVVDFGTQPSKRGPKWKDLAQRKLEVAQQEMNLREQEFAQGGKTTLEMALDTSKRLLDAELDVYEQTEKRVAAYQRHIQRLELFEKKCVTLYQAGRMSRQELLQAQYAVLDMKMRLLAEQGE